ncbi:putative spermidine/putrescine transport system permease protein [Defluviimonas denitrificans]|jgi:putative spermidine/putrescine transport system permease protein|uniref:Putative spermidine/putrescine transport system permease protein n=1 Tax=Albidovulum denitrificans TaxID=404881 RepID=A0A2S8S650_9RHOB|nr:ABC transporter permease [Defluviimonas denitrificans]PQV56291.1 putative spermidine/putrescine transport system permease protein [Defluviimonas denitrificans]
MSQSTTNRRGAAFYLLATFFALFVIFLYGPMLMIFILSFQGPTGGLTFPMRGVSTHWFHDLWTSSRYGDLGGAFRRSLVLGGLSLAITAVVCLFAGLAFRRRFWGAGPIFYLSIVSLVVPGILLGLGISQLFQLLGLRLAWWLSGLGAHLSWTLPFGLLIMFAVLNRFDGSWEEAARDAGASPRQVLSYVTVPILFPGLIAVALFGFTLSYDEMPRSLLTVGAKNTLPIEISNMTTNVTTPALYAIGTVTSAVSFLVIATAFITIAIVQKRRARAKGKSA